MLQYSNEIQQERDTKRAHRGACINRSIDWVLAVAGQYRQAGIWSDHGEGSSISGASVQLRSGNRRYSSRYGIGPYLPFCGSELSGRRGVSTSEMRKSVSLGASDSRHKCQARARRIDSQGKNGRENALQARPRIYRIKHMEGFTRASLLPGMRSSTGVQWSAAKDDKIWKCRAENSLSKRSRNDSREYRDASRTYRVQNMSSHTGKAATY